MHKPMCVEEMTGYDLTYTYQDFVGHKFQLANVQDVNYRTEGTAEENDKVNNGHRYTYDDNGNLVYINTSRVKKDGKEDEKATEQKYRWDEENRLLAADENGFVSNYWYDAEGERTVKTSGEGEQIYVNSEFAGGRTNTAKFSLYVSPYLVANQGGRYTKHIYIGSQRIVSKLGDFASYGSDPRRIPYAGSEADAVNVDYKGKYSAQQQVIKDNYATFNVPYNGEDNNDYVDGEGFCCSDGTLEAAQAKAMAANVAGAKAISGNFKENDDYEKMQFYYHPDHLGSSSYITNLDGEVAQHIEYVPFGEVFIEERNNTWNTPYLFNAKEFDEETGMYYYGARYYEPRLSLWMSVDPISNYDPRNSENYLDGKHNGGVFNAYNLNPYSYCYQTPIRFVDPNGKQVDIVITNKVVGKTQIRLIGHENYQDAPKTVETNLYQMTVTDRKTKTVSTYNVTRDAPVAVGTDEDWFSDNETYVANTAFEPAGKNGHYKGVALSYPHGTDLEAIALMNLDYTPLLKTDKNRNTPDGGTKGFAKGIMIHVGGDYQNKAGDTFTTGSFGCFGISSGNSAIKKFISDVVTRQGQNRDKTINITVQKRNNVDWNYVVDSSGNKTTVGL